MGSLGIHLGLGQWFILYLSFQRLGHGSLHRFFTFTAWQWIQLTQRCRVSPLWYFAHILVFPKIPPSNFFFFFFLIPLAFCTSHNSMRLRPPSQKCIRKTGKEKVVRGPHIPSYTTGAILPCSSGQRDKFCTQSFRSLSYCTASMVGLSVTMRRGKKKDSPIFFSRQGPFFPDPLDRSYPHNLYLYLSALIMQFHDWD